MNNLAITEEIRNLYLRGKRVFSLSQDIFPLTDSNIKALQGREEHTTLLRALKYLKKSRFFDNIPPDIYYDVISDIIVEVLENKDRVDLRLLLFRLKRKYVPNYIAFIHHQKTSWGEWVFQTFGEEYTSKSARGYKTISLYLPEPVYGILERNSSRSKSVQFIIDLLADRSKIRPSTTLFRSSRKRKGSVKIPLPSYWKLLSIKKRTGLSVNQLVLSGLELLIIKNFRR